MKVINELTPDEINQLAEKLAIDSNFDLRYQVGERLGELQSTLNSLDRKTNRMVDLVNQKSDPTEEAKSLLREVNVLLGSIISLDSWIHQKAKKVI